MEVGCDPWFQDICLYRRMMVTIEEDLEELAAALRVGIDPFPPSKPKRSLGRMAIASFMIILMLSWVSKLLMRFL